MININSELKKIQKFVPLIEKHSKDEDVDIDIITGIAIIENMNRPTWFRFIEKFFSAFKKNGTYGLMQVHSQKLLSDTKSIQRACKIIKKSNTADLALIGQIYNGNRDYGQILEYVVQELKKNKEWKVF